ncbi:MAG: ABC transporter permease [Defluviitaleaceae bacterium]|nr:ABC transporter permease [Defluviitaleaceae bacterium]
MRRLIFVTLNMFLLVGSLGLILYAYAVSGRYFVHDVLYIAPRVNEARLHFAPSDVELLEISFPNYTFATVSRIGVQIASSTQEVRAIAIYTNAAYFEMHAIGFIEGSFVQAFMVGGNFIVVNEALAWRLFGATENITGLTVLVNEEQYVISGVVRQSTDYTIWLPRNVDMQNIPISSIYLRPNEYSPLSEHQARTMLSLYLHGHPADFAIVDINRFVESINIRHQILLYLIWLSVLVFLIQITWRAAQAKSIKTLIFSIGGVVLCLYILWGLNDFLLWLPNLSLPDSSVFTSISTIGMLPPDDYLSAGLLRISQISKQVNFAFVVGIVAYVNNMFFIALEKAA